MVKPSRYSATVEKQMLMLFVLFLAAHTGFAQVANFTVDVNSGCAPLTVRFTDASTGTITSRHWDFANGNTSPLKDPSAVYVTPDTYIVTLTVYNGAQSSTKTATIVVHGAPVADFLYDKSSGCSPLGVKFTDKSVSPSGAITDWFWVFGDGGTSTAANPTYVFNTSGPRTVTLKVKNQYGCEDSEVKGSAINVQGPHAEFTADNAQVCQVPATIQFRNHSTGAVSYDWEFGDGKNSTAEEPSNTYTDAGTYNVVLKARDVQGCESSHSLTVNAGSEGGLDFTPSATQVCIGETITFSVQADAPIVSRDWNFGNGTSSTDVNALVTYGSKGTYTVKLDAMLHGKSCHSVVTKTIEVLADPEPSFTYKADCNYNVTFTSTTKSATRLEWYIGNMLYSTSSTFTRAFAAAGNYDIKLIVYNSRNCSKTLEQTISIEGKPVAAFTPDKEQHCTEPSLSGCAPFTVQFANKSDAGPGGFTSQWQFRNVATTTTVTTAARSPQHTFAKGNFIVTLKVSNAQGCTATATAKVAVADEKPVARFTLDKPEVCSREPVTFTAQQDKGNFWCWDFGDGETGTGLQVVHKYVEPGVYTVRLTAKNAGCSDTYEIVNAVKVNAPLVNFELHKNCFDPYAIGLLNLSSDYHAIEWDFGDGKKMNKDTVGYRYKAVGDYSVKLTATNTVTHCIVSVVSSITIRDVRADFEIDNVKPCRGAPVKFTDKSDAAVKWEWAFGDGTVSSISDPVTSYSNSGQFNARLRVYDADGCFDDKVLPVDVLNMHGDFALSATSTCDKFTVDFKNYSTGDPLVTNWHWDFGDGHTSADKEPQHVYTAVGSYPVTLTLTNAEGNCSFIRYDAVRFTNPVPDFSTTKPATCIDSPVIITNWSKDATTFKWDFGDGRSSSNIHAQVSYPATGSYDVTLSAADSYGCERSVTKPAFISVTKPVAAFEAFETEGACPPLTSIFNNLSTGNVVGSHWDFGDGNYSVLPNPANTYLRPGTFDVKLTATDKNGCTDTTTMENLIRVGGPDGTYSSSLVAPSCVNTVVQFTATTTNAVVHRWDYGDGNVEDLSVMNTAHLYAGTGSFNTSLVLIDDNGCKVAAQGQAKIVINDTTKIDFQYSPQCIFQGDAFLLKAEAAEAMTWAWEIDGHAAGTDADQPVLLDTAGMYNVVLHGTNQDGCTSTIAHVVPVHGSITFIPNIFTPNNDTYNDRFEIMDLEKSKWDLHVYNRWGDPVYKKDDYLNDWDGGNLASGVYYFKLSNAFCEREYKGHVTIAR